MPRITGLATTAVINAVENKIGNVSDLVKKTDYDAKKSDIETKYFTISDLNFFWGETLNAKIKGKELVDISDISGFIYNYYLDKKRAALATKAELKANQDKIVKLQAFDSSYFRGRNDFER